MVPQRTKAQLTEQEVLNGANIVSTGNVHLDQTASGAQSVEINGVPVDMGRDGIYRSGTGQVVVNNGRIVSTGDVTVSQSASATQDVNITYATPEYDGQPADVCVLGSVMANPWTGQLFYQKDDCCWYAACASSCKNCDTCVR
jgi:hypothetical protein